MRRLRLILVFLSVIAARAEIHQIHEQKLGVLPCSLCHVPAARGSVMLKRPGHDQCRTCHGAEFQNFRILESGFCSQCHRGTGAELLPFPRTRAILSGFSHAHHIDSKARVDQASGVRADCTFCHKPGAEVGLPTHAQCAACHSKAETRPRLSASVVNSECRGCHAPGEAQVRNAAIESFRDIRFSHATHLPDCTTCHRAVLRSDRFADLPMPVMADCVACHKTNDCKSCHADRVHLPAVRPASHTASFRIHHAAEASAADAKCFACHQNVSPSAKARDQCIECHLVMKPRSHTARWKDDLHGQYSAIDRVSCAACHTADSCARCHNELPHSHVPLPLFKAGGHARLAMLDQRACMTCHTFQNTCAECHVRR
jgi:hypothetical protein